VNALLREEIIVETGRGESNELGGKPPTLLKLNPQVLAGVGCIVRGGAVLSCLAGFDGQIEVVRERRFDPDSTPLEVVEVIGKTIGDAVSTNRPDRPVLGVGLGMAGGVDERGRIRMTRMRGWVDFPLAETLADRLGLPVAVENESRVRAVAERWFGLGRDHDDFVCLLLGRGIACGVFVNGRLLRGKHSLAGEVGHTRLFGSGKRCRCGADSCWESGASIEQLIANVRVAVASSSTTWHIQPDAIDLQWVVRHFEMGEPVVVQEVRAHAAVIARGICNIVLSYDPGLIILYGDSARLGDAFVDIVRGEVHDRFASFLEFEPPISLSQLGTEGDLAGAVSLALGRAWGLDGRALYELQ
jgi:predicted NBD/HSP70 family sugar kinase